MGDQAATLDLRSPGIVAATAASLPDSPPGFQLEAEVAHGGMGVIYQARDLAMNRTVAVKLLRDRYSVESSGAKRFAEEAQITGQLQHPGIPPIYQVGTLADGRPFLAMKLIKGQTLDALLKSNTTFNKLAVFEAVAQAVGYAHAHGVIHRDLKPANIMVGAFGEVQVMDWGLAKLLTTIREHQRSDDKAPIHTPPATTFYDPRSGSSGSETQVGSILGTPAYMAPEQAAGEVEKIDQRTDVFGLGAVMCQMLTGQPPFTGKSAEAVRVIALRGKTEEAFTRLDGCGAEPDVIGLCKRCLAFEPADRPADGNAVAAEVARLRAEAEERARQVELAEARAEEERRARERIDAVLEFMEDRIFAAARPQGMEGGLGYNITLADAMKSCLGHLETDLEGQPLVEARLCRTIGRSFLFLGRADWALPLFSRSVALFTEHLRRDHAETLTSINNLAASYSALGRHLEALALHEEILELRKSELGPDHRDTLVTRNNLANTYTHLSRHAESLALREETLNLMKAKLGPDHPDTLMGMHNLANSFYVLSRHAEALALNQETLERRKSRLGPDHPDTLGTMNNLASCFAALGNQQEALALRAETLKLMRVRLGPEHPDTSLAMTNLANSFRQVKRLDEALPLLEEAAQGLEKREFVHNNAPYIMSLTAAAYEEAGQWGKAEAWRRMWLAHVREKHGPESNEHLRELTGLATNLTRQKKFAEAEPLLLDVHGVLSNLSQPNPKALAQTLDRLIELSTTLEKPDEVKKWQAEKEKLGQP